MGPRVKSVSLAGPWRGVGRWQGKQAFWAERPVAHRTGGLEGRWRQRNAWRSAKTDPANEEETLPQWLCHPTCPLAPWSPQSWLRRTYVNIEHGLSVNASPESSSRAARLGGPVATGRRSHLGAVRSPQEPSAI